MLKVTEWQRRNGAIVVDRQSTPHVRHQLELPKNSAFLTDVSLLVAEKLLATLAKVGKFAKVSTLDRHCLFAPLSLEARRDTNDFSKELIKILKSSPVDKGATETSYSLESGKILSRVITTASGIRYFLQDLEMSTSECDEGVEDFQDQFFAENLHQTIQRNLDILRKHIYQENLTRNLIKFNNLLNGKPNSAARKSSVVSIIKQALVEVLKHKPEDPLEFLKRHFMQLKKRNGTKRATSIAWN